jgi:hypothetical protein
MNPLIDKLRLLCPYVAAADDALLEKMLILAAEFAPPCLSDKLKERAVLFYAGYLAVNALSAAAQGAVVVPVGVVSEREGDLSRSYGNNGGDPCGYLAQYQKLADLCKRGAIIVSQYGGGCGCGN